MLDQGVSARINSSLNFETPDRVPICEFIDNPKVFEYFCADPDPEITERVKAYHKLGIDVCWRFDRRQSQRHEGLMERLQRFALRKSRLGLLGRQQLLQGFEEYSAHKKVFEPYTYLAMMSEGCLSVAYNSMGFEDFCRKMYTELIEVERLIDVCAENLRQRADLFAEQALGPLFFVRDDIAYEKGLLFSKGFLDQHWIPRIRSAVEALKIKNIRVILHSRGDLSDYLEGIIEAGFDGIHPVDLTAGMDIGLIKKKYARSLLLFGNVDLVNTDPDGSLDIASRTKKCIESVGSGHFISSVSGITKQVKLQQALSFFSHIKEFGTFPSK